jgi:hypothetical protein
MTHRVRVEDTGLVFINGERQAAHLTKREADFLRSVLSRRNTSTKDMLLNDLYGGRDEPDVKIVDVFAFKVRFKLGQHRGAVETVWGRGYMPGDNYEMEAQLGTAVVQLDAKTSQLLSDAAFESSMSPADLAGLLLKDALTAHRARLWAA